MRAIWPITRVITTSSSRRKQSAVSGKLQSYPAHQTDCPSRSGIMIKRLYPFCVVAVAFLLVAGMTLPSFSQSRRQPPTSNEKKNKRPGETKPGEQQQEPVPKDIEPTNKQDIEKVSISTQIVNVDA